METIDYLQSKYFHISDELVALSLKCYDIPDSEFDPEQLALGIKIEKEHSDSDLVAKTIAKAHLKEIPNYYTYLIDMEKRAKANLPIKD